MRLSAEQLKAFDEGLCLFPQLFFGRRDRAAAQRRKMILKLDRQEVWREKTGAPRTAFAAHTSMRYLG